MIKSEKFIISGVVQGVGFRYFTAHQGIKLGLTGYAHNLGNGDVEVIATGSQESLELLYEWLKQGAPMASVDCVHRSECFPETPLKGFAIH